MIPNELTSSRSHLTNSQISVILNSDAENTTIDPTWLEHLERCKTCQTLFTNLTDDKWWKITGRHLIPLQIKPDDLNTPHRDQQSIAFKKTLASSISGIDVIRHLVNHFDPVVQAELLGRVDEYVIESVLGVGGMGIVFKGFDTDLNRAVAIKFLSPFLVGHELARERFFREAKAAAAVCHENVIPIYRVSDCHGYPYFVMPLVSHESLQSIVDKHGPLSLIAAVQIGLQLAAGIAAAHEQGLIHRDIKPANVLLENQINRAVLSDFGLVYDLCSTPITQTGVIAGTPAYMSPEQAAGDPVVYSSDLFSLGSVLWFAVTGSPPFSGDNTIRVLNQIRHCEVNLAEARPDLPKHFVFIVEKLMAKSSGDRYESANQLRQVLAEYLAYLQNPTQHRIPKQLCRRKTNSTSQFRRVTLGLGVALIASYLFSNWLLSDTPKPQTDASTYPPNTQSRQLLPDSRSPDFVETREP